MSLYRPNTHPARLRQERMAHLAMGLVNAIIFHFVNRIQDKLPPFQQPLNYRISIKLPPSNLSKGVIKSGLHGSPVSIWVLGGHLFICTSRSPRLIPSWASYRATSVELLIESVLTWVYVLKLFLFLSYPDRFSLPRRNYRKSGFHSGLAIKVHKMLLIVSLSLASEQPPKADSL